MARLRPGVTFADARRDIAAVGDQLAREQHDDQGWKADARTLRDQQVPSDIRLIVMTMMGAVTLVLLIACANVANLLLSRATCVSARWRCARSRLTAACFAFSAVRRHDRDVLAAVIFDFDGVILDSETPEYESHKQVFGMFGVPLSLDDYLRHVGLYHVDHETQWFMRLCAQSPAPPDRETFDAERKRVFNALVPGEPMRGIVDLLDALAAARVPLAIASTSTSRWVVPAAERLGIRARFATVVTGDDVERRKPAPDVYLEAARRLGVDPARSIAVEDSAPGIASARAAGMKTVAIPHWLTERHDLSAADLRVAHAGELTLERLARLVGL
ncbi:MAG: HAD-IA family hydrolase [Acidobacteria bacterium]|nr:HAD-IA family hydrolase [Acidobacteriota bacterium]